jgi:crotonobetainyl-CoA:carnitine CoA-transferase CaiB-like acyl-CoA transferase
MTGTPGMSSPPGGRLPLSGVTVVACEQAVSTPLATRQLADLGARVIKVEREDGGDFARRYDEVVHGQSSVFLWLNRGKESIQLNLKNPAALEALHGLLDRADVFVANLAPSALRRLGLTVAELRERHPRLIPCVVSGYSQTGSNAGKKAYDALIQAESGLMSLTGAAGRPAKVGISIADIAAGTYACSGVLAAIRHRDVTGEALPVEVSLFSALTEWMAYPLYYTQHSGTAPTPMGTSHPTIAPYGAFPTGDGRSIMLAVQNDREWARLCTDVLKQPDLAGDPRFSSNTRRTAHRGELDETLAKGFARYSAEELTSQLDAAGIAWGHLTEVSELAGHPELAAEDRWLQTGTEVGPVPTLRPPGVPGDRVDEEAAVPALGQHTSAVLAEFGLKLGAPDEQQGGML